MIKFKSALRLYLIIAALILTVIALIYIFKKDAIPNPIPTKQYLAQVYPLLPQKFATKKFAQSLEFYYVPFPQSITDGKRPLECLSWMYNCGNTKGGSMFRNVYLHNLSPRAGTPSHHHVEVIHYGWYNEPALYFYVAKGTGIYFNVGRTLIAQNKMDALRKLGLSELQIFSYLNKYYIPDKDSKGPFPKKLQSMYTTVKLYAEHYHITFDQALHRIFKKAQNPHNYYLNRFNDSSDFDIALYKACRKKGYDTIQLTVQPNENNGWGYELMDCRTSYNTPLIERWKKIERYFSQRNPKNLSEYKACHYNVPFTSKLACS